MARVDVRFDQRVHERLVLLTVHGTVEVVGVLAEASGLESDGIVDGIPLDDRGDRIVEGQAGLPEQTHDRAR